MNKCPKCGAPREELIDGTAYECGSLGGRKGELCEESKQCLRNQLAAAEERIAELDDECQTQMKIVLSQYERAEKAEAIVEKLPKTADGVVWLPWHKRPVYWYANGAVREMRFGKVLNPTATNCLSRFEWIMEDDDGYGCMISQCYSTLKAAEAAKEAT